jgi:hypothetical protein
MRVIAFMNVACTSDGDGNSNVVASKAAANRLGAYNAARAASSEISKANPGFKSSRSFFATR